MRCLTCSSYSFLLICSTCQKTLLTPTLTIRQLENNFKVYSFYKYKEIDYLLKTKHTHIGAQIYAILAKLSFGTFAKEFSFSSVVCVVPVDDRPKSGYAHTAILSHALQAPNYRICYRTLRATNSVTYSGKSLLYRRSHPRKFKTNLKENREVILVDDIITTGTTLLEAKKAVESAGAVPLFSLTLADASEV